MKTKYRMITWETADKGVIKTTHCRICGHEHVCPNSANHKRSTHTYVRVNISVINEKKRISKAFSPKKYGNKEKALRAAIKWRNGKLKEYGLEHRLKGD